ncbi:FAD/NAD(P)-binding protein [Nakamurella flavida]|uniref:FAD/NAD(P)-binding protein n=1 Tax=Nakamurella flavida TaxID=363630 RepID=A0A938YK90_9ACTN|nr:FAD/NAD(P)-binding protein [Nakamurella flavida]MBM9476709.1 FAD/NAD(P)-binding protein [Nakamurella flavida]MDP9778853.1 hypothetical protein [Nakamurella flavida]
MTATDSPTVVFVGGGPRTVSLLDRLGANAPELLGDRPVDVHVVDPYPVGGGRIWRADQSPLLWMNSRTRDVTMFTDDSVRCRGPITPGPSLDGWLRGPGRAVLAAAGLPDAADSYGPDDFAPRKVQAQYLAWVWERAVAALPAGVRLTTHAARAVSLVDLPDGRQRLHLSDGDVLDADVVVLAQGYLDRTLTADERSLADAAVEHGLTYVPPGYTADLDLSGLRAGQDVIVRGFGLAFIDLMVLTMEQRGGRFVERDGVLSYRPSGAEPVLHVGSRRGVPYHAKLGYAVNTGGPVAPRYFTPGALADLAGPAGTLDFREQVWPLIVRELTDAHYRRLFAAHPERTRGSFADLEPIIATMGPDAAELAAVVETAVPDPVDRFVVPALDRPLAGHSFTGPDTLTDALVGHITEDLRRSADPAHSADGAVFDALLTVYGVLLGAVAAGRISPVDRVRYTEGQFHGFFSFVASGPPPRRLAELLAVHRAGLVRFLGPDLQVSVDAAGDRDDPAFVATSPAVPGLRLRAAAMIDARLPRPDVREATDPLIRGLLADGELAAEDLRDADGRSLGGGQLRADVRARAVRADRTLHERRFLLGPSVSGSAGAAGFARPNFNAPGFRQNDQVARDILGLLTATGIDRSAPSLAASAAHA